MVTALWLKDLAERVVRTALQAVIAALVLSAPFDLTAAKTLVFVALSAGFTVVVEAVRMLLESRPATGRLWSMDTLERLVLTFLQTFLAAFLTTGSYDLNTAKTAALAGVAAIVSLLMSVLAKPVPRTLTPASLVKAPPGPARTT
jgi:hypothetical protein